VTPSLLVVLVIGVAAFGTVLALVLYFSRDARIKRAIRNATLATTQGFQDRTIGKIHGTLRYLDEPLKAPLSGRLCAYYEVLVEEYRSNGKSGSWHEIICERQSQDFLVEDETGMARVTMQGAEVAVVKDSHRASGTFKAATPDLEAFLARHGRSSKGWLFNKSLRYKEGVLAAGELVAVCGLGTREPDPDPRAATGGYRDQAMRLVLSGNAEMPLYATDDPSVLG
jgi:hypothetical protein